jgi:hypothetical protein
MNAQQLVDHMIGMEMTLDADYARVVRDARQDLQVALGGRDTTKTVGIYPHAGSHPAAGMDWAEQVVVSREAKIQVALTEARRVADMYAPYA